MQEVSTFRLYTLRVMYLIIVVGLAVFIWPSYLRGPESEHMEGVVYSMLAALSLLAVLGIRYPLQMIPLLLFELLWKTLWIAAIGFPLWRAGTLAGGEAGTLFDNLLGLVLVPLALPWKYVIDTYLRRPGDRWGGSPRAETEPA